MSSRIYTIDCVGVWLDKDYFNKLLEDFNSNNMLNKETYEESIKTITEIIKAKAKPLDIYDIADAFAEVFNDNNLFFLNENNYPLVNKIDFQTGKLCEEIYEFEDFGYYIQIYNKNFYIYKPEFNSPMGLLNIIKKSMIYIPNNWDIKEHIIYISAIVKG